MDYAADQSGRRSTVSERHRTVIGASATFIALLLSIFSVIAVIMLTAAEERELLVMGGFAGGTASSLALLVQTSGATRLKEDAALFGALAPLLSVACGFAGGLFSVLLAIGLFEVDTSNAGRTGAAVFGGFNGLVLGGLLHQLVKSAERVGEASVVGAALREFDRGIVGATPINYDGHLFYAAQSEKTNSIIAARLVGHFIPSEHGRPSDRDTDDDWTSAQIIVEDGVDAPVAEFVVSALVDQLTPFPRSVAVQCPLDRPSHRFEIALTRMETLTGDRNTSTFSGDEGAPRSVPVLIDVSQSGRTLQILEVPVRLYESPST